MAQKREWRRRVSPQAVFQEQPEEPAGTFLNRVGVLFYGSEWTPATLEALKSRDAPVPAGSDVDLALIVRDQVISGLQSGRLSAIVRLTVAAWASVRLDVLAGDWENLTSEEIAEAIERPFNDPLIGEDATPKQRPFAVKAGFWRTFEPDLSIDWDLSNITISAEHLRDDSSSSRRDQPIREFYDVQEVVRDAPLRIRYPFRALRELVRYEDLPDEAWFRRYERYRDKGRVEALAAMWRYLAVGGFDAGNAPSAADLARRTSEYLSGEGFSRAREANRARERDSSLEEMARLVLSHLKEKNPSSSVLVSSNPRRRRSA